MGTGASRNYDVGPKNHWRRTIWNEILRRTAGQEKEKLILYLAGPQDLDRKVALQKGVPDQNLVAIDVVMENVSRVREEGRPALKGDLIDVLWSWPEDWPVCAVLMDFCSGIEWGNGGAYDAFETKPLRNAAIMVNFMRGRDRWSNEIRENLDRAGLLKPLWRTTLPGGEPELVVEDTTNRAFQFLMFHAWDLFCVMETGEARDPGPRGTRGEMLIPDDEHTVREFNAEIGLILGMMKPRFFSYRSGQLVFDSAVFHSHARGLDRAPAHFQEVKKRAEVAIAQNITKMRSPELARAIAATLTVRTRRLRRR